VGISWLCLPGQLVIFGLCFHLGLRTILAERPFAFSVAPFMLVLVAAILPDPAVRCIVELRAATHSSITLNGSIELLMLAVVFAYIWWTRPALVVIGACDDLLHDALHRALAKEKIPFLAEPPTLLLTELDAKLVVGKQDFMGTTQMFIKGSVPKDAVRRLVATLGKELDGPPITAMNRRAGPLFLLCAAAGAVGTCMFYLK
jgi:hypothetical protein